MAHIFTVTNQKGGVGKTTTSVNIATAFAAIGKQVLLVDLDPQGNASTGFGVHERSRSSYDILLQEMPISEATQPTEIPGLDIIPATVDLASVDVELANSEGRETLLKAAFASVDKPYDLIFIDTPPSLGLLTINALTAAHQAIVPMQCEFYALEGLAHLLRTIEMVRAHLNPSLDIFGIILTMYDRRNRLTKDVEQDVRNHMGEMVFNTVIPRNVRLSEAPSHGKPAIVYDHKSPGSEAYLFLAKEMLQRLNKAGNLRAA